jgi:hypothetical protein
MKNNAAKVGFAALDDASLDTEKRSKLVIEDDYFRQIQSDCIYASLISLPRASRPNAARPARERATKTTVMARTAR